MTAPTGDTAVLDASALVALLVESGPEGRWVAASLPRGRVAAPELALFEAANILRRLSASGLLDDSQATLAHAELLDVPLELWPYGPLAGRAWQLRQNFTVYDAAYVALAETLDAPLITIDGGLARAPGARCQIVAYARGTT